MKKYWIIFFVIIFIVVSVAIIHWWKIGSVREVSNEAGEQAEIAESSIIAKNDVIVKDKTVVTNSDTVSKYDTGVVQKITPVKVSPYSGGSYTEEFPKCRLSRKDTVKKNQLLRARITTSAEKISNYEIFWRSNFIVRGQGNSEASFSFREKGPQMITANLTRISDGQVTRVNCPIISVI